MIGIKNFNEVDRKQFISRSLIEESITSSQLEGANTSRAVAKKMLIEGRKPKNKSEQMILNNHAAMKWIEEEAKDREMSMELLFEMHRKITDQTLTDSEDEGKIRETLDKDGNPLVVEPWPNKDDIAYIAPTKEFVEAQLPKLIDFANNDGSGQDFIHPLFKAIILHFWIALLHPFEDGNGRLARVIFYWYMLRKGYWSFSYISISEAIKKSPMKYSMSYIYSEQDDNDLNYFIHYNMECLRKARKSFEEYAARKISENQQESEIVKKGYKFNSRQIALMQYLNKDKRHCTNLKIYMNVNNDIGKVTAASDLKNLVDEGLLEKVRNGRNIFYYPTSKLKTIFN